MTVGGILATLLGLAVGIGGMWLAWKLVKRLPADEHRPPQPEEGAGGDGAADE